MSLPGLIRARGSRCTVRRATRVRQPNGSYNATWASQVSDCPVLLAPLAQQKAQYLFGRETKASAIVYFEPGTDVRADDGLLFTGGFKNGQHFRVLGEAPSAQFALAGGPAMLAMAVELTPEAFA